jgi:type IV pilus assembly protein PilE
VLAMIAFPSYQKYMQRTRRAQAKADLSEIAGQLEREFTVNRSFAGYALSFTTSPRDGGGVVAYQLAGVITPSAYILTAAPVNSQATDLCGNLTLNQTGLRQHSTGDNPNCNWGLVGP